MTLARKRIAALFVATSLYGSAFAQSHNGARWSTLEVGYAVALIIFLMAINALLHAGESALFNLRANRIRDLAEIKDPRAPALQRLNENSHAYFATCQIGFQLCRVGIYAIAAILALNFSRTVAEATDYDVTTFMLLTVAFVFFAAFVNLAFAELPFRGIARKNPDWWAAKLYSFLEAARVVLLPLVIVVGFVSSILTRRFGVGPLFSAPAVTEEDLRELVDATGASGELIEDEKEMIHSIIEFTDTVAREVMTPRTEIDAAEITSTAQDIARLIGETGHTRIPIYEENIDRIVGIVHAKDLLKTLLEGNGNDVRKIMRPALFIPESKDLHQLLTEFRRMRTLMAIVQDEFGGTDGLVTIEDLVEEIVGEIVDEYDVEEPEVQCLDANSWLLDGRMNLDDVNDEIGSAFESEEFDTLGGYVFGLFGRQPVQGESIDEGDWHLEVAETDGRRVVRVLARRHVPVA